MHDDSEVIQRKLLKLLQDLIPDASMADAAAVNQKLTDGGGTARTEATNFLQDASSETSRHHASESISPARESLFELGEIPAVQDRFYSLLKNRLQAEIQRNPPLFPWETEIHDYETETPPFAAIAAEPVAEPAIAGSPKVGAGFWGSQLKHLNLPVPVPEKVLTQLLQRCQEVVQSSLLEGAKLVRAVEELFPNQSPALNHLAGLVMTSPARSGGTTAPAPDANYPSSYEAAASPQQMVLSLLAAREIIASLTLTLSTDTPAVEREWLTEVGAFSLKAEYQSAPAAALRVQANLPSGGGLILRGSGLQSSAERLSAGQLKVELSDIQPSELYSLEVRLTEKDATPLTFAVRIVED